MPDVGEDEGELTARDGLRLRTIRWGYGERAIALVHGYLEHAERYSEIATYLAARGYAVHAFDHRGHGRSAGVRGYVRTFDDYLGDVDALIASIRARVSRVFLVGHSMGGLIALAYATGRTDLAGVAVSSPYLRNAVPVSGIRMAALQVLARVAPRAQLASPLKASALSHDPEILERHASDALILRHYTPGWGLALLRAQQQMRANAPRFRLPLLVMAAGADTVADPSAAREFYERAGSTDKTLLWYDDHYHENFNEADRRRVYADLERWLAGR